MSMIINSCQVRHSNNCNTSIISYRLKIYTDVELEISSPKNRGEGERGVPFFHTFALQQWQVLDFHYDSEVQGEGVLKECVF